MGIFYLGYHLYTLRGLRWIPSPPFLLGSWQKRYSDLWGYRVLILHKYADQQLMACPILVQQLNWIRIRPCRYRVHAYFQLLYFDYVLKSKRQSGRVDLNQRRVQHLLRMGYYCHHFERGFHAQSDGRVWRSTVCLRRLCNSGFPLGSSHYLQPSFIHVKKPTLWLSLHLGLAGDQFWARNKQTSDDYD